MWLYQYSHYKDKMVSRTSYLCTGNLHTAKDILYIESGLSDAEIFLLPGRHLAKATTISMHYGDVKWPSRRLELLVNRVFVQHFVQADNNETSKVLVTVLLWGESTGHRWIPHIKRQLRGNGIISWVYQRDKRSIFRRHLKQFFASKTRHGICVTFSLNNLSGKQILIHDQGHV